MASEIYPQKGADTTGSEHLPQPPPVVLTGPKTTVTPRTNNAPRGKIFEDEARGTVFWEIAESSDEDDTGDAEQVRAQDRWGNPFRVEWIKWYCLSFRSSNSAGMSLSPFSGLGCFGTLGTETKKSKYPVTAQSSSHQSAPDFSGNSMSIRQQPPKGIQGCL